MYREDLILLHEESTAKDKIRASEIVQYEFARQWFGNLVTCSWWDYAWLNEGFAQYFKFFATKMVCVKYVKRVVVEVTFSFIVYSYALLM